MTPSGVQKRIRVIAFTMTRSLSAPLRSSVHLSGLEP